MRTNSEAKRDNFYLDMMKKYNLKDWEDVIDIINDEENEIREQLEGAAK